ncbi:MAG: sulfurtransferase TusA family protein [Burkholderiaceae bacterium]|jgi:tRNA 2-thiouridine synthesizing protein A
MDVHANPAPGSQASHASGPATRTLELQGLSCPLPILKAKKALGEMNSGEQLLVISTDRGSWDDFDYFCANTGHALLERKEDQGQFKFLIRCK